jgi:hypothetical protein
MYTIPSLAFDNYTARLLAILENILRRSIVKYLADFLIVHFFEKLIFHQLKSTSLKNISLVYLLKSNRLNNILSPRLVSLIKIVNSFRDTELLLGKR